MHLPPAPNSPSAIQILRWIFTPMSYMDECASKYGDIYTLNLNPNYPAVYINNPDALQTVLSSDTKELSSPGELNVIFTFLLGTQSVITASGKQHQRKRQLIMPALHGERMRAYADIINQVTDSVISKLPIGAYESIRNVTQTITLKIIMQAVFGLYDSPRATELERVLSDILESTSSPLSLATGIFPILGKVLGKFNPAHNFDTLRQQADKIIYEEIQERRNNQDSQTRVDILSLLMSARDEDGQAMTDVELRDELMTLLTAGHETTATALAWAVYFIYKNENVKTKLLEELNSLGKNPDSNVIFKLPYLTAVCNETLRIYPVGLLCFPRRVEKPISLCGYDLEPGTLVYGSIYNTHRRQDLYPNPDEFKPERFLERQYSAYEFLPFGGGARRCIGLAFAQFEMKLVLAKILTSYQLELLTKNKVNPKRRGLVSAPDRPIYMNRLS
ncbi:cytochrome P450 [Calothrix sp. PCC 7716]|nr:cytochrome P450 [Calothrix sp. PCC 7716]